MADSRAEAIRRRVAGWRAAELHEHEVRRAEPILDPEASLDAALELCELLPGSDQPDVVRTREVAHARRAWATLRLRMACRVADPQR